MGSHKLLVACMYMHMYTCISGVWVYLDLRYCIYCYDNTGVGILGGLEVYTAKSMYMYMYIIIHVPGVWHAWTLKVYDTAGIIVWSLFRVCIIICSRLRHLTELHPLPSTLSEP